MSHEQGNGGGVKWAAIATVVAALTAGGYAYVKYKAQREQGSTQPASLNLTGKQNSKVKKTAKPGDKPSADTPKTSESEAPAAEPQIEAADNNQGGGGSIPASDKTENAIPPGPAKDSSSGGGSDAPDAKTPAPPPTEEIRSENPEERPAKPADEASRKQDGDSDAPAGKTATPEPKTETTTKEAEDAPVSQPPAEVLKPAATVETLDCDRLAADWPDAQATARPVDVREVRGFTAISACEEAVEKHPDVARFRHQLAYAQSADGRHEEAFEGFKQLAETGYRPSMRRLGVAYYNGQGVAKDETKGLEWLENAANAGDGLAAKLLGKQYASGGDSVPADPAKSTQWFRKAMELFRRDAEAGVFHAAYMVGEAYELGQGVEKDVGTARDWYLRGAEKDQDPDAMERLGLFYQHGDGETEKDLEEALRWYRRAAEAGSALGMNQVGFFHFKGLGGANKDLKAAADWYHRAAKAGNAVAMSNIAWCYEHGSGVPLNYENARYWYLEAFLRGEKLEGLKSETVAAIQKELQGEGFFDGDAEGTMNDATQEALKKFAAANLR